MKHKILITKAILINGKQQSHYIDFNAVVSKSELERMRNDLKREYNLHNVLFVYDEKI
jgi:hypothetical protein